VPTCAQDTVNVTDWPLSSITDGGDIVTVVPVSAAFTVTDLLAQKVTGVPALLSVTLTEKEVVDVRTPVV
jgi:hypothetical protein